MRLVEGSSLSALLARSFNLEPEPALRLLGQIAGALDAVHSIGIVHGPVNGANVLLDGDASYLADFGLRKRPHHVGVGDDPALVDGLAPEQIDGAALDGRTDVYGLACLFFQMITGVPPFGGRTPAARLRAHLSKPPARASGLRRELPRVVDHAFDRALAKSPTARFPTCGALAQAMAEVLSSAPAAAPPSQVFLAGPASSAPAPPHRERGRALESAQQAATGFALDGPSPRRRARRAWPMLTGLVGVLAMGGAAFALLREEPPPLPPRLAAVPAPTLRADPPVVVGSEPSALALSPGAVWVADAREGVVRRLGGPGGAGGLPRRPIRVGRSPTAVTAGAGGVWVANGGDDTVSRVDRRSAERIGRAIPVGDAPVAVALGARSAWVVNRGDAALSRIDRREGAVRGRPIPVGRDARAVATTDTAVWVANGSDGSVSRIDITGARPVSRSIRMGGAPAALAVGAETVWVASADDGTVGRLAAASGRPVGRTITVGGRPEGIGFGHGYVWVADRQRDQVLRLRPRDGRLAGRPIRVGEGPTSLRVAPDAVWVLNREGRSLSRIPVSR